MNDERVRSPLLISAAQSVLLIVDVQDRLLALMDSPDALLGKLQQLAAAAQLLQVPRLATEQYPEKLGPLSGALLKYYEQGPGHEIPGKLSFSCAGCPAAMDQLRRLGRPQVVLAGLETHVCIAQTALDLIGAGLDVFLVADAVATRHRMDHDTALRRLESAGVTLVTTEAVLFEWCERAGSREFKEISRIVRFGVSS